MRAIVSVSDKSGVVEFARGLAALGIDLYSTGGTKKSLSGAGVPVHSVSDITGFPEILDGRVKTLHPKVHGGILARRDLPAHLAQLQESGISAIDMVVVNLYPFVQTVTKASVTLQDALENIDIGGPTMIRAAAKNFPSVLVVVDPADYEPVLEALKAGEVSQEQRQRLAQKAFQHVAMYDTAIAEYLRPAEELFPDNLTLSMTKMQKLRYGENPHQQAAYYIRNSVRSLPSGVARAQQLWGKELSYNNFLDADAAWNAATDFSEPTVAVVKHTNPCGLASRPKLVDAYRLAFAADTVSAFGGIVALNRVVDRETATEIDKVFYEIVMAPGYDADALELLKRKRDVRILVMPAPTAGAALDIRYVGGGFLVQTADRVPEGQVKMNTVTKRAPTPEEVADLLFAWRAVKHVKSNAIVLIKNKALLGMGAGQPNRVTSVGLAVEKAGDKAAGSVLGSDAFFPFPDGVERAGKAGVTAIIQPGGSVRDKDAIAMADQYNMAMVLTGERHFRH